MLRFAQDNNNIWSTGVAFVPVSLTIAAVYFTTDQGWGELAAFAALTMVVMASWWLIAENHSAFQQLANAVMWGIEEHLGIRVGRPKLPEAEGPNWWANKVDVSFVRRALPVLFALFWVGVAVARSL